MFPPIRSLLHWIHERNRFNETLHCAWNTYTHHEYASLRAVVLRLRPPSGKGIYYPGGRGFCRRGQFSSHFALTFPIARSIIRSPLSSHFSNLRLTSRSRCPLFSILVPLISFFANRESREKRRESKSLKRNITLETLLQIYVRWKSGKSSTDDCDSIGGD